MLLPNFFLFFIFYFFLDGGWKGGERGEGCCFPDFQSKRVSADEVEHIGGLADVGDANEETTCVDGEIVAAES